MKKYIVYLLIGSTIACSDFLEPDSPTEYTPETVEHLNEMILHDGYIKYSESGSFCGILELITDDVVTAGYLKEYDGLYNNPYTTDANLQTLKTVYTWQPDYSQRMAEYGPRIDNLYGAYYNKLVGVNVCFDLIEEVSGTAAEKAYVLAQASALRAFYYLMLVNIYGAPYNVNKEALGVPIRTTAKIEDKAFYRNTVEEVYDRILEDALAAEKYFDLVDESLYARKNYRINLPMVQLLLARIYLYMENWEKAVEYADKVMAWDDFSLVNLNQLGTVTDNSELYNFISYPNNTNARVAPEESIWVFGNIADVVEQRIGEVGSISELDPAPNLFQASVSLVNSYQEGDLRLMHYLAKETNTADMTGVISGYRAYGKVAVTNTGVPVTSSSLGNFGRAFRLSEAYLIAAEANAMLYKEKGNGSAAQQAISLLNELRVNRISSDLYEPVALIDADELVTFVRKERRRELCYEIHRWFDLRRWGMPAITRVWMPGSAEVESPYEESYTLQHNDNSYTLPLPVSALNGNSNLVQNPLAPVRRRN